MRLQSLSQQPDARRQRAVLLRCRRSDPAGAAHRLRKLANLPSNPRFASKSPAQPLRIDVVEGFLYA